MQKLLLNLFISGFIPKANIWSFTWGRPWTSDFRRGLRSLAGFSANSTPCKVWQLDLSEFLRKQIYLKCFWLWRLFFTSHPGRNGCSQEEEKDSLSESCCQTSPMYPWWEYWTSEGRLSESWGEICQTSLWLESWLRDISISRYLERFCHMLVMGWVHVDTIMSALFVRNVIISRSLALIKVNQISGYQMISHLDINRSLPRMIMCRRSL